MDTAIIGIAGIYPGAPEVLVLWNNILAKAEAVTDAPDSWNARRYHDSLADGSANTRTYCKRGGFIEQYAEFDPMEFGIMPSSVDGGDPGHFLTLRVAKEALADAGYTDRPFDRRRVGVIVGHGSYPHRGMTSSGAHSVVEGFFEVLRQAVPELPAGVVDDLSRRMKSRLPPFTPDTCPGLVSNVLSGRIANRLDLMGPNYLVDAACASSLIALDAGVRELESGRCDMMLVGGAQENTNAGVFIVFSMLGALSRRGRLRPFDKNADGTLLGEGVGFAVIKRLADAERDGDRIYAVIKGIGLSSDGQENAFLVPRLDGEVAAMERAYLAAGLSPETVELVEAHGTGTAVGDRTEVQAMTRVFGARDGRLPRCAAGSVKSMISHTIPASGMAGLFKTALALYHKVLPPTLCEEPNPDLGIDKSAIYINTESRPWINGKAHPRRAGVSAFGFGGINSHVVLEEHSPRLSGETLLSDWRHELVLHGAESRTALRNAVLTTLRFLEENPGAPLRDVAFTMNSRNPAGAPCCLAVVAASAGDLAAKLLTAEAALADETRASINDRNGVYFFSRPMAREGTLAFLFPGEGAQYAGMLSDLCIHFDVVRQWFDRVDRAFADRGREPLPSQIVFPPPHMAPAERDLVEAALWKMEYAIPLITAADGGLYHLMVLLGVRPHAMAGHSTAQDLAIEAAAGIDKTDPGNVMHKPVVEERVMERAVLDLVPPARLMSVGASDPGRVASLAAESNGTLFVAMDNCPNQVVLCGTPEAVEAARATLTDEGALCQFLPFDRGYHTPMYRPVCDMLENTTSSCEDRIPGIPVYCTTTGRRLPESAADIRRVMIDQWSEPIRFRETVETMHADGVRVFLEVGPRGNLTGFVDDTLSGRDHAAIPCNLQSRSGMEQLLHALGQLCAHGVPVNVSPLFVGRGAILLRPEEGPPKKPTRKKHVIRLKMDMPLVSLDEADSKLLRDSLTAALRSPDAVSETAASAPRKTVENPVGHAGDRPALDSHLRLMEELLATHEEVVLAAMDGRGSA